MSATREDPLETLFPLTPHLTEQERAVQASMRALVEREVLPHVGRWFRDGHFPRHLVRELARLGALGPTLTGYGCAGVSPVAYGLLCMELERGDSGLRSFLSVQSSLCMFPIHAYGSEAQKSRWLPRLAAGDAIGCFALTEPSSGSNPAGMQTNARRDGDDWILDGRKAWITSGSVADVAVVWARTEEGVRGFLIERGTPGFESHAIEGKLSLRTSDTAELSFEGVRLPADAMLPGVRGLKGPLSCLTQARFGISFGALGAGQACYEAARDYARERIQFGKPLGAFQLTQEKLADMLEALVQGRLLALHLGRQLEAGSASPEAVSLAKRANVRAALGIARSARSVLGANGVSDAYPPIRHMLNLESVLTYEGTHEVHTLVLGKAITGLDAFGAA